jgi:hypothetical protein
VRVRPSSGSVERVWHDASREAAAPRVRCAGMAIKKSDQHDDVRLPIKLDSSSNGEYWPLEPDARLAHVVARARESAGANARKLGLSRREYLTSACGAASVLLGMNELGSRRRNAASRTGRAASAATC